MKAQFYDTPKRGSKQAVKRYIRGRGEVKRVNVCAYCTVPNSRNLIKIKRAGGDFHLCKLHARLMGVS